MFYDKDNLFVYLFEKLMKDETIIIIKKTIEFYATIKDKGNYLKQCNLKLYKLSNKYISKKSIDRKPISENDNIRNHYSLEGSESISKKECCGLHIHWMNGEYDKFDDYYCANLEITN